MKYLIDRSSKSAFLLHKPQEDTSYTDHLVRRVGEECKSNSSIWKSYSVNYVSKIKFHIGYTMFL